jgi:hypothetical protein
MHGFVRIAWAANNSFDSSSWRRFCGAEHTDGAVQFLPLDSRILDSSGARIHAKGVAIGSEWTCKLGDCMEHSQRRFGQSCILCPRQAVPGANESKVPVSFALRKREICVSPSTTHAQEFFGGGLHTWERWVVKSLVAKEILESHL